jgi:hypothetical protein
MDKSSTNASRYKSATSAKKRNRATGRTAEQPKLDADLVDHEKDKNSQPVKRTKTSTSPRPRNSNRSGATSNKPPSSVHQGHQERQRTEDDPPLIRCLRLVDPVLQFLTKATGQTTVPVKILLATLPAGGSSLPLAATTTSTVKTTTTTTTTSPAATVSNQSPSSRNGGDETHRSMTQPQQQQQQPLSEAALLLLSQIADLADRQILEMVVLGTSETRLPVSAPSVSSYSSVASSSSRYQSWSTLSWSDDSIMLDRARVGFPSPPEATSPESDDHHNTFSFSTTTTDPTHSSSSYHEQHSQQYHQEVQTKKVKAISSSGGLRGLHGSTKTAAKRRLIALRRLLKEEEKQQQSESTQRAKPHLPKELEQRNEQQELTTRVATSDSCTMAVVSPDTKDTLEETAIRAKNTSGEGLDDSKDWVLMPPPTDGRTRNTRKLDAVDDEEVVKGDMDPLLSNREEQQARDALQQMFQFPPTSSDRVSDREMLLTSKATTTTSTNVPQSVLPKQVSYAGSYPAQGSRFGTLSEESLACIPEFLLEAFQLDTQSTESKLSPLQSSPSSSTNPPLLRQLYIHQVEAIESALQGIPTLVCTGTGSGKSLCFLLPVLAAAYTQGKTSIILFPTKALAQDQVGKLNAILSVLNETLQIRKHKTPSNNSNNDVPLNCPDYNVMAATLDGDCSHAQRAHVVQHAKVILTNPDTLHAAILPQHEKLYQPLLDRVEYVVVDEAHMYEGVFGAHVTMVLSRLARACALSRCRWGGTGGDGDVRRNPKGPTNLPNEYNQRPPGPTFLACSATMSHPEHHFRLLCPLPPGCKVTIVKEDGSPRSSKHFFVWNPPLLDIVGNTTGLVQYQKKRQTKQNEQHSKEPPTDILSTKAMNDQTRGALLDVGKNASAPKDGTNVTLCSGISKHEKIRRRHSADETAVLLARAVTCGVRCIAFCKSRCLVEWVYEKAIASLQRDPNTAHLTSRVQSYRGGYTQKERRRIEEQLFQNKLLAVVGTSALELVSHRSIHFLIAISTISLMRQL